MNFSIFEIMRAFIAIMFLVIFGIVIAALVKGIAQWHHNNQQPKLTVDAVAVTKRIDLSSNMIPVAGDASGAHGYMSSSDTDYFITFEVENGDRMEFPVNGNLYGMIAEGDRGKLSFQGTRFLSFNRYKQEA